MLIGPWERRGTEVISRTSAAAGDVPIARCATVEIAKVVAEAPELRRLLANALQALNETECDCDIDHQILCAAERGPDPELINDIERALGRADGTRS